MPNSFSKADKIDHKKVYAQLIQIYKQFYL